MGMPLMDFPGSPSDKDRIAIERRMATLEADHRNEREFMRHIWQAHQDLRSEFEAYRRTSTAPTPPTGLRLQDGNGLMAVKIAGAIALVVVAAALQAAGQPDLAAKVGAISRAMP